MGSAILQVANIYVYFCYYLSFKYVHAMSQNPKCLIFYYSLKNLHFNLYFVNFVLYFWSKREMFLRFLKMLFVFDIKLNFSLFSSIWNFCICRCKYNVWDLPFCKWQIFMYISVIMLLSNMFI